MSDRPSASAGWTRRLDDFVKRRGVLVALALGAVVLFAGIGSSGLWEPWEMDRADLARTLASPPEAVAAFAKDTAASGAKAPGAAERAFLTAAQDEGLFVKMPDAGAPTALRATLDLARTRTVAAIVIDQKLLVPDPARDDLWQQAGKLVGEALRYAAGAAVVVVRDPAGPPAAELARRLEVARWKDVWETSTATWGLAEAFDDKGVAAAAEGSPSGLQAAAEALAGAGNGELVVLEAGDAAGLAAALDDGKGAVGARVAFKDNGATVTLPPLETWTRAAAYRIFGPSEWTTRLPGVVLALITLWVLLTTVRTVWGTRVAFFTGVVLATLPLFFAQARIISGEPGAILALTLTGCGLLLQTLSGPASDKPRVSRRVVWGYLVAALVVGLFTKGAYALTVSGAVALALPLVTGPSKKLADWAPAVMFLAAAALVEVLARGASPGSMWAGLDFRGAMFEEGPPIYSRTFDMVVKQLGFGLAPWSPVMVVALGLLTFSALEKRGYTGRVGLVVVAWFFVPVAVLMASLSLGNQFLFAGAAAGAVAVALMLERLARGESGPKYFVAFALVVMFYVMRRELKETPAPLVSYLAFDPPFAKEGSLRFPETVEFFWVFKQSMIVAALACLVHFGGFLGFAVRAARWLRNSRPYMIVTGIVLFLGALFGLGVVGRLHGIGMSSRFAGSIQASQKALIGRLTGDDPLFVVGMLTLVLFIALIVLRWGFPTVSRALAERLPDARTPKAQRVFFGAAAVAWLGAAVAAWLSVTTPDGYWGELLLSVTGVSALVGAALVGLIVWSWNRPTVWERLPVDWKRARGWWQTPVLAAVAVFGLVVATQITRDASHTTSFVTLLVLLGFAALAIAVVPRVIGRTDLFLFTFFALMALMVMGWIVPLADRAGLVTEVVLPDVANPQGYGWRLLLSSIWFVGPILFVFALLINRALPRLVVAIWSFVLRRRKLALIGGGEMQAVVVDRTDRLAAWLERGRVLVVVLLTVGLVGAVSHLVKLEPAIATNVSQKHILDTWRAIAGETAPIYKHGAFATQGRKDANFYTAAIPEIRDRQAALKVLLGREDEVLEVETETGSETLVFPGWSDKNDLNKDGRRDVPALRGFATAVGDTTLTDASQSWAPKQLVGKRLSDSAGRNWTIVDNDATSVRVAPEERLAFALSPRSRAAYVIDDPRYDSTATADRHERRALLLPADQLSELNYAFRLLSDGRHLPVLDGSSYRVLLTTSWLEASEPQQNRLALATFDDKSFAALKDPRLIREWGNFDDTIQIVGYATDKSTVSTGETMKLTVYYKTLKLVKKSLKIFIHIDKSGGGARIAGDHWPLNPTKHTEENKNCNGCYRTDHWLVGDIVRDDYDIEIPEGNTGEYTIWLGLYQPGPDTRLPVKSWDQKRMKHDGQNRLGLGTIQVK